MLLAAGCAAHVLGVVEQKPTGLTLTTPVGKEIRVVLLDEARPLRFLDGHLVEVWGVRVGKTVKVNDWKVQEGLHGLSVWVGPLEERGVQLGMHDRNSGAYYLFDEEAARDLARYAGKMVLVEGYVVGAHEVRVVYYRVLAEDSVQP
jgi:hypothetical protein